MKVNPQAILQRENLNLRLGIKSALPDLTKLFAVVYSLYAATGKSEIDFSTEYISASGKTAIKLKPEFEELINRFFGSQLESSGIPPADFLNYFNNSPLFSQHLEALQVALELYWKIGIIKFADSTFGNTKERTGGNRYSKVIYLSTNVDIVDLAFSTPDNDLSMGFKNWLYEKITNSTTSDSQIQNKISRLLTIFSEETAYKIRSGAQEIIFQTIGIYNELINSNTVESSDTKEEVGPFRILKSSTSDNLNYFISDTRNDGFVLNERSDILQLKEYASRVNTMLSLSPKNSSIEIIENVQQLPESSRENFTNKNIIFYGAPGTGKSYKVDQKIRTLDKHYYERITFHPEFDNASFIGGYKPIAEKNNEGKDEITYKFVPQAFAKIYARAWKESGDQDYYLVIEEINRGNCAEIFGEIFQLLDRDSNYDVTPSEEFKKYLINEFGDEDHEGIKRGLKLPSNLHIWATMNTSDQSLFPMDSAFKRRWEWEYIPICYKDTDELGNSNPSSSYVIDIDDGHKYSWIDFIGKINQEHILTEPALGMDKCIGNYFIKPDEGNIIKLKPFINKVIFYLWNDVFKDENNEIFLKGETYESYFPIYDSGKQKIKDLFTRLSLNPVASYEEREEEEELGNVAEIRPVNEE